MEIVSQAEDYTKKWRHDPVNMRDASVYLFQVEQKAIKVPIKSYVEYGLDKASEKEEFKA